MVSNDDRTVADTRVLWCFCAIFIDKERQGKTLNVIWFDMKNDCFYFVERWKKLEKEIVIDIV